MPNNLIIQLNAASVQVIDAAATGSYQNTYRVNSAVGDITLLGNKATYESYASIASGAGTVLTLPAATIWFVYVKNLDATANLTVQVQPLGGALPSAANSPIIVPGGVYLYANPTEGAGGVSAVTLVSSVGNTPAEILLGA